MVNCLSQSLDEARHSFALITEEDFIVGRTEDFFLKNNCPVKHVSEKTRLGIDSPTATTGFYPFF